MKIFKLRTMTLFGLLCASSAAWADSYEESRDAFIAVVRENSVTEGGAWLEMQNAFGEWEKVVLVFGFADPGDYAACESIRVFAGDQNPGRVYRCNPVN